MSPCPRLAPKTKQQKTLAKPSDSISAKLNSGFGITRHLRLKMHFQNASLPYSFTKMGHLGVYQWNYGQPHGREAAGPSGLRLNLGPGPASVCSHLDPTHSMESAAKVCSCWGLYSACFLAFLGPPRLAVGSGVWPQSPQHRFLEEGTGKACLTSHIPWSKLGFWVPALSLPSPTPW